MSTPSEKYLKKQIKQLDKQTRMEKELRKRGRKVPAGYMWTIGDLQRFFEKKTRKKSSKTK